MRRDVRSVGSLYYSQLSLTLDIQRSCEIFLSGQGNFYGDGIQVDFGKDVIYMLFDFLFEFLLMDLMMVNVYKCRFCSFCIFIYIQL